MTYLCFLLPDVHKFWCTTCVSHGFAARTCRPKDFLVLFACLSVNLSVFKITQIKIVIFLFIWEGITFFESY